MDLEYILTRWQKVRAGLIETIDKFHDEELDFRPYPTAWSAKQIMLHIGQEEYGEFHYGIVQTLDEFPPEYPDQDYPTTAAIKSLLDSIHAQTLTGLQALDDADLGQVLHTPWGASYQLIEMIDHIIEHEVHHRAELSLILGMLGREGFNA